MTGLLSTVVLPLCADDTPLTVKVDAFLNRNIETLDTQYFPLLTLGTYQVPETERSVAQAIDYLLRDSGYRLCPIRAKKPHVRAILGADLPTLHRTLTDVTLIEALRLLVGPHHDVVIDPLLRRVGYELNEYGQKLPLLH